MIGQTLAHYRVTAALGAGGMGEVYRATDTRLGREVAIKALPAEVVSDPERLGRFRREAQMLASLNHPRVAAIHGLEDIGGRPFLVLELVEGEDLSQRLKRGPLPVDEAFELAGQIAEALEGAHERGIVHRDLKPANVKITPDGEVKVLDFGLAKAWAAEAGDSSPDLSASPTLAHTGTAAGVILGTAAYMSPEQARGRRVDKRADVWALGVVLFEMLTGRRLFAGETASEILAAVIKDEPDWSVLPEAVPPRAVAVLRRCLARDPKARLHDAADVRLLLEDAMQPDAPAGTSEAPPPSRWRERVAWVAATLALGIAAIALLQPSADRPPETPLTRFAVVLPEEQPLVLADVPIVALSRDGRGLAFVAVDPESGQSMIHYRTLDQTRARPLPGTEGGLGPFFSPDGRHLAFFAGGQLKKVPISGGPALALASAPTTRGGVWAEDGSIFYSPEYTSGVWRVSSVGGAPELVVAPDLDKGERTYRWPDILPGGHGMLFTIGTLNSPNDFTRASIAAYSFETNTVEVLLEGASMARFVPPDQLVYARTGILYTVPFDAERLRVAGAPRPVLEGVGGDPSSGAGHFALARDGALAYVPGGVGEDSRFVTMIDREGQQRRLSLNPGGLHHPRFSPDGERLAYVVGVGASGAGGDIWIHSLATGAQSRLTFAGEAAYPLWTRDGRSITFFDSSAGTIVTKEADGSGSPETVTAKQSTPLLPDSWSPDGRTLAYTSMGQSNDVYLIEPGGQARVFEENASGAVFSPDGRWIAYSSPASGTSSIFVRPVDGEGKWQVSPGQGGYARWSGDGRQLYYIAIREPGRPLMKVDVRPGETFEASAPKTVLEALPIARFVTSTAPLVNWDLSRTGDTFVFIELDRDWAEGNRIQVALGWARHVAEAGGPGGDKDD